MTLDFNSEIVKENINAICDYFEAQARGEASTLKINGRVVLSCDGRQGIDYNNEDARFLNFDYEGLVIAFSQLSDALEALTAETVIISDTTERNGIKSKREIVAVHPLSVKPFIPFLPKADDTHVDTETFLVLTQSGYNKMNAFFRSFIPSYNTYSTKQREETIQKWIFDKKPNKQGIVYISKEYYERAFACKLVLGEDIKSVSAKTTITQSNINYGNDYDVLSGGHNSHSHHNNSSSYFYSGYGA